MCSIMKSWILREFVWIFTFLWMNVLVATDDYTGIMSGTLFTFKNTACGGEKLRLRCPFGTTIRIQGAQYGRRQPSALMCGAPDLLGPKRPEGFKEDTNCLADSALQIVLNKCQDRRTCRLVASAQQFGDDPCPGTSKYLEVAYKCRPNQFMSRITCESENLILKCKKSLRIAVYSAKFGRSLRGNLECPAEDRSNRAMNNSRLPWNGTFLEECESTCSLDTVMNRCHGKRRCTITASTATFGDPCDPGTRKYLSVIYVCVPKRILKEIKNNEDGYPNTFCNIEKPPEESPETETPSDGIPPTRRTGKKTSTTTQPTKIINKGDLTPVPDFSTFKYEIITSPRPPPNKGPENQSEKGSTETETTEPSVTGGVEVSAVKDDYVGFVTDWIYTYSFIKDNLEKFILYVILGLFLGLILLLITIIIRMAQTKRHKKRRAKLNISEPVPNSSGQTEDLELLSDSDRTDGIEILSINHNNRPPPFRTDTGNRSMNSSYYG